MKKETDSKKGVKSAATAATGAPAGKSAPPFADQEAAKAAGIKGRAARAAKSGRIALTDTDILDALARAVLMIREGFKMKSPPVIAPPAEARRNKPPSNSELGRAQQRKEDRHDRYYALHYKGAVDLVKHYVGPAVLSDLMEHARAVAEARGKGEEVGEKPAPEGLRTGMGAAILARAAELGDAGTKH